MRSIDEIADDIERYATQTVKLEMTIRHLFINLHDSPFYNFRDALSHYIRLYETTDNDEKTSQETSITEHLSRGIKDACFYLIDEMKIRITDTIYDLSIIKSKEIILRKQLHLFKEMEIRIRGNSIMLSIGALTPIIDELIQKIRDTENLFLQNNLIFKANANYRMP